MSTLLVKSGIQAFMYLLVIIPVKYFTLLSWYRKEQFRVQAPTAKIELIVGWVSGVQRSCGSCRCARWMCPNSLQLGSAAQIGIVPAWLELVGR